MIKLAFKKPYKSLRKLAYTELPDFTVITGLNGSGKTHFLEAIREGAIAVEGCAVGPKIGDIRFFNWDTLVPKDAGPTNPLQLAQERSTAWDNINQTITASRASLESLARSFGFPISSSDSLGPLLNIQEAGYDDITIETPASAKKPYAAWRKAITRTENNLLATLQRTDKNHQFLVKSIAEKARKSIVAITREDYDRYYPIGWSSIDIFQSSFSRVFADYYRIRRDNKFRKFLNLSEGEDQFFWDDEEFLAVYGSPPWEFVNRVLDSSRLPFKVTSPESEEKPFQPMLVHRVSGAEIKFSDLSSGERVLISFALCVYNVQDTRQALEIPKLLLLDEVDATLHPIMTKSLIETITNTIVKEKGIRVILVTHSPPTVALAPEEAIYALNAGSEKNVCCVGRDQALRLLTFGVPALSIRHENRRKVFVESIHDAEIYELFCQALMSQLMPEISLNLVISVVPQPAGSGQAHGVSLQGAHNPRHPHMRGPGHAPESHPVPARHVT